LVAKSVLTDATPAAIAARQILLDDYAVAFCDAPTFRRAVANFGDKTNVLMTPDARRAFKLLIAAVSLPQMPAISIFSKASSAEISGIGYSRSSTLREPICVAARTFSLMKVLS
jgi:hypothetical protein